MRDKISGLEIAGILGALLPFICHFSSSSSINGQVVSYFDVVGVIGGIVAIVVAIAMAARHWPVLEMGLAYVALVAGILIIGVYQLVHGAGLIGV